MDKTLPPDQHAWNAFIFFLFPIMIYAAYLFIQRFAGLQALYAMSIFDILIMVFATYRIIRLIAYDKIFSFARVIFFDVGPDNTLMKPAGGFRRAVVELIDCIWCVGVWAALFVIVLYVISPIARFGALILAISALGTFMQVISRRVGSAAHQG